MKTDYRYRCFYSKAITVCLWQSMYGTNYGIQRFDPIWIMKRIGTIGKGNRRVINRDFCTDEQSFWMLTFLFSHFESIHTIVSVSTVQNHESNLLEFLIELFSWRLINLNHIKILCSESHRQTVKQRYNLLVNLTYTMQLSTIRKDSLLRFPLWRVCSLCLGVVQFIEMLFSHF